MCEGVSKIIELGQQLHQRRRVCVCVSVREKGELTREGDNIHRCVIIYISALCMFVCMCAHTPVCYSLLFTSVAIRCSLHTLESSVHEVQDCIRLR